MSQAEKSPVTLVVGGVPQVRIGVASAASAAEEYAAEELRRHLHMMAGRGFSLRNRYETTGPAIHVNDREAAQAAGIDVAALGLRPEAFHIESRGGSVYILGGGPRGVLYGVYHLLEMLGCRWFTPEVSRIPRLDRIELPPVCVTQAPAFEFRDMFNWEQGDPVWWVRNRMNGWYTPVPEYMGGHVTYELFVHTYYRLVPPEEFFATHPEYFSMIGGVRRHQGGQLCLTNPDVLRIVVDRVLEHMRKNPKASIVSVSQNDWTGPCECPACAAVVAEEGAQSGPVLRFANAVAEATSKVFPDKLIDTLAYQYTLDAPRKAVPHPNVRVRLCSIRCCQGHGFEHCDDPKSVQFLRALDDWGRVTKQMYIWHYCTNFANYMLPVPDIDELHENIGLYHRRGVYGIFMQGMGEEGGGAESMALRGYVISKLLWNPNQPVWPIVDEFLSGFYGAAAPKVRTYLDLFHDRVRNDRSLHPSLYIPPTHPLFAGDILERADAALSQGETLARGDEKRRVRMLRYGIAYARLTGRTVLFRRDGDVFRSDATDRDRRDFETMVHEWKRAGVQRLREAVPFDDTVKRIRNRLVSHRLHSLREGEQEVAVAPSLGGRMIEWHAYGRQWLAPPDPDNAWDPYPMSHGFTDFVTDLLGGGYLGPAEAYRLRRKDAATVVLTVDLGDATRKARLRRTCTLKAGALHVATRVKNLGTIPITVGWGAGLHMYLPDEVRVWFETKSGALSFQKADIPDGLGAATVLSGDRLPTGVWQVEIPGYRITHRFDSGAVSRAILGKIAAKHVVALDVRTDARPLAPGQSLAIEQEVRIEPVK